MKKASNYAFISKPRSQQAAQQQNLGSLPAAHLYGGLTKPVEADLNVVVLAFDTMKEA
jgi:hypothetical protein